MPDIAIQIVNYRTKRWLERCLPGLEADLAGSPLDCRISVLDNASGDDLSGLRKAHPSVSFRESDANLGFGGGQNLLAAGSDAEYLLLLNPDVTFVEPRTVERLYASLRADPRYQVAGPQLRTPDDRPQAWDHGELRGVRAYIANEAGNSFWRPRRKRAPVAWVSGACLLIERAAFERLGGFDERLFLYKEEEDLCLRLRRQGGGVLYDPSIRLVHEGSVVTARDEDLRRSVEYFTEKHVARDRRHRVIRWMDAAINRRELTLRSAGPRERSGTRGTSALRRGR